MKLFAIIIGLILLTALISGCAKQEVITDDKTGDTKDIVSAPESIETVDDGLIDSNDDIDVVEIV